MTESDKVHTKRSCYGPRKCQEMFYFVSGLLDNRPRRPERKLRYWNSSFLKRQTDQNKLFGLWVMTQNFIFRTINSSYASPFVHSLNVLSLMAREPMIMSFKHGVKIPLPADNLFAFASWLRGFQMSLFNSATDFLSRDKFSAHVEEANELAKSFCRRCPCVCFRSSQHCPWCAL